MKYTFEIMKEYEDAFGGISVYGVSEDKKLMVDFVALEELEDAQKEIDEAYQRGLEEGKKATWGLVADASSAEYQRGLNDAWEAARKIFGYEIDGGIPIDKIGSVFGYSKDAIFCTADIFRHNNASEAIEKLKAYEEQKADGEIKVGDIVDWDGDKYIVSYINDDGCADLIYIKCGSTCERVSPDCFTRTGKHFDIDKILAEMKE